MDTNPFAVLSFIVAPSILTNATSVLIMSTSNRLARAVDRARELSKQLEESSTFATTQARRRLNELSRAERRTLLLMQSLRSFYAALGGFAAAALISLLGAVTVPSGLDYAVHLMVLSGIIVGILAVGALIRGSWLLLTETRIAVEVITERAASVHARAGDLAVFVDADKRL
jgi:Protein of unknown function (DUF2721)